MSISDIFDKRQRLTIILAVLGLLIAVALWGYSELQRSSGPLAGLMFAILCPPSLLSIPLIDVEVGTSDYRIMWAVFVIMNSALYAGIGSMVGKARWKAGE